MTDYWFLVVYKQEVGLEDKIKSRIFHTALNNFYFTHFLLNVFNAPAVNELENPERTLTRWWWGQENIASPDDRLVCGPDQTALAFLYFI